MGPGAQKGLRSIWCPTLAEAMKGLGCRVLGKLGFHFAPQILLELANILRSMKAVHDGNRNCNGKVSA